LKDDRGPTVLHLAVNLVDVGLIPGVVVIVIDDIVASASEVLPLAPLIIN